jgi:oxygen-independent coproporphyrinogen-3 oxidase
MKLEAALARTGAPLTEIFPPAADPTGPRHRARTPDSGAAPRFASRAAGAFAGGAGRPLALYLHAPFCRKRCHFCPFFRNRISYGFSETYCQALIREIRLTAQILGGNEARKRPVSAVYFGGGTPSDLEADDLAAVLGELRSRFQFTGDTEVTVEGRVRGFTREKAEAWTRAGANRFSLGIQSTDTSLRRSLGRIADRAEIAATLNTLSATGAVVIVDLIHGLPGQDPGSLVGDVRFLARETAIDGLDLYALKVFPGSPLEQSVADGTLPAFPGRSLSAEAFLQAREALAGEGFQPFTPKHWRRSRRERSVYNQLATEEADILSFGSAGGGRIGSFSLMQHAVLEDYYHAIEQGAKPCRLTWNPSTPGSRARRRLAAHLNRCSLPAPSSWGLPPGEADRLAANWRQAGLIRDADHRNPDRGFTLTAGGAYWHERMLALLAGLQDRQAPQAVTAGPSSP